MKPKDKIEFVINIGYHTTMTLGAAMIATHLDVPAFIGVFVYFIFRQSKLSD